jgi:hypothetical protein
MKKCFSNNLLTFLEIKIMFSKRIIFVLAFVLTMFEVSAYGQQDDCIDANTPPGATCGNWVQKSKILVLGGLFYQNCEFIVTYETRICQVTNGSCTQYFEQFHLVSVEWSWESPDCQAFTLFLMPGYPDEISGFSKTAYEDFLGDMLPVLMDVQATEFFASLTPLQKSAIQCDQPNCSMPYCSGYTTSYISTSCQDMCIDYSNPYHNIVKHGFCYADPPACCLVSYKFCWCAATGSMTSGPVTVLSNSGNCTGNGPLYGECPVGPGNGIIYNGCTSICPTIP